MNTQRSTGRRESAKRDRTAHQGHLRFAPLLLGGLVALMSVVLIIKAQLSPGVPLNDDRRSGQAGTGGARNRVIRARICPNIRRDTATSARATPFG